MTWPRIDLGIAVAAVATARHARAVKGPPSVSDSGPDWVGVVTSRRMASSCFVLLVCLGRGAEAQTSTCVGNPLLALTGTWVFSVQGFTGPATNALGAAGRFTATIDTDQNGDQVGVLKITQSSGIGDQSTRLESDIGAFQINSDCSGGSLTFNLSTRPVQYDFFFVNTDEIALISTNRGDVVDGSAERVDAGLENPSCSGNPIQPFTGTWTFLIEGSSLGPPGGLASAGRSQLSVAADRTGQPLGTLTTVHTTSANGTTTRLVNGGGSFQPNSECSGGTLTFTSAILSGQADVFWINRHKWIAGPPPAPWATTIHFQFPFPFICVLALSPRIVGLDRSSAPVGGPGVNVKIMGSGFSNSVQVTFKSQTLNISSRSLTAIQVTIPAQALTEAGTFKLTVTDPAQSCDAASTDFTVSLPPPKKIPFDINVCTSPNQTFNVSVTGTGPNQTFPPPTVSGPVTDFGISGPCQALSLSEYKAVLMSPDLNIGQWTFTATVPFRGQLTCKTDVNTTSVVTFDYTSGTPQCKITP
jgi:hypothetical protein